MKKEEDLGQNGEITWERLWEEKGKFTRNEENDKKAKCTYTQGPFIN